MGKYYIDHRSFHFEIYKGEGDDKNFYWRLYYHGDIIATGHQGFGTPKQCEGQIHLVIVGADPETKIKHSY